MQWLLNHQIQTVVDIRYSTFYPIRYRPEVFRSYLLPKQISYIHWVPFGNPPENRPPHRFYPEAKQRYFEHLQKIPKEVESLKKMSLDQNICLICMCPTEDLTQCHRFWLKEYIEKI